MKRDHGSDRGRDEEKALKRLQAAMAELEDAVRALCDRCLSGLPPEQRPKLSDRRSPRGWREGPDAHGPEVN